MPQNFSVFCDPEVKGSCCFLIVSHPLSLFSNVLVFSFLSLSLHKNLTSWLLQVFLRIILSPLKGKMYFSLYICKVRVSKSRFWLDDGLKSSQVNHRSFNCLSYGNHFIYIFCQVELSCIKESKAKAKTVANQKYET